MSSSPFTIINFAINNANLELYKSNLNNIRSYMQRGECVPSFLLGLHFTLLVPVEYFENIEIRDKCTAIANKASEKFKGEANKEYQFEGHKKVSDGEKSVFVAYSIYDMFFFATYKYYSLLNGGEIDESRAAVLQCFYREIDLYVQNYFNDQHISECDRFKKTVFAAHLTMAIGLKVSNEKEPTNYDLYQSSKYYIKNL